jgi:hypothetical protein
MKTPLIRALPHHRLESYDYSLGVLFMLWLRFIISALQILLFAQHSYKVINTQGSSSKTTDAFFAQPSSGRLSWQIL